MTVPPLTVSFLDRSRSSGTCLSRLKPISSLITHPDRSLTVLLAHEPLMVPMLMLESSPAVPGSAMTAPVPNQLVTVPAFMPTRPPSVLPSPPVTFPLALELAIEPLLAPTSRR